MASPGAVAVIETPESFILEARPEIPGELAYSGKLQLFGGHVDPNEAPAAAIARELNEEIGLSPEEPPLLVWSGMVDSQNRAGEPVERHVSLFRVAIDSVAQLTLNVPGSIAEVPKTLNDVEAHADKLTPFALRALKKVLTGEEW